MLLRLACPPSDWTRLAAALDAADSPILARVVRTMLAAASRPRAAEDAALIFTVEQAGELQRVAASLGLSLPATPVVDRPDPPGWATAPAERAAAVAAAEAIVRAHQRQRSAW